MKRIRVIVAKEWAELFRNRLLLGTVLFLPFAFTFLALTTEVSVAMLPDAPASEMEQIPEMFAKACPLQDPNDCVVVYLSWVYHVLFMMLPLLIPTGIAAHGIVGEKTARTLEPLLATPISTTELLAAKALAAGIPGVVATWIAFGVYLACTAAIVPSDVFAAIVTPAWLAVVLVLSPLLAGIGVGTAVIVSSRVNDARTAEQVSGLVVLPILAALVAQVAGMLLLSPSIVVVIAAFVLVVDVAVFALAVRLFDRESILTRWR